MNNTVKLRQLYCFDFPDVFKSATSQLHSLVIAVVVSWLLPISSYPRKHGYSYSVCQRGSSCLTYHGADTSISSIISKSKILHGKTLANGIDINRHRKVGKGRYLYCNCLVRSLSRCERSGPILSCFSEDYGRTYNSSQVRQCVPLV